MRFALSFLAALPALAGASAQEIMARVAANQDRAERLRSRYVYTQTTAIRIRDSHNQLVREETTAYAMTPLPKAPVEKKFPSFANTDSASNCSRARNQVRPSRTDFAIKAMPI